MTIRGRLIIEVGSLHVVLNWSRRPSIDLEIFNENEEAGEDGNDEDVDKDDDDSMN